MFPIIYHVKVQNIVGRASSGCRKCVRMPNEYVTNVCLCTVCTPRVKLRILMLYKVLYCMSMAYKLDDYLHYHRLHLKITEEKKALLIVMKKLRLQ